MIVVSTMENNDGSSPPTDQQTSKSSGGAKLSLEEKFSLLVDKMEKQTEQFKLMSAAFQEAQRQAAEAKESKNLLYKIFIVLSPYCYFSRACNPESSMYLFLSLQEMRSRSSKNLFITQRIV